MTDWIAAEVEYIAGSMSLKALAEKLGVSYSTLSKVAAEGHWTEKRKEHRKKVATKSLSRARARDGKKLDRLLLSAESLLDTAISAMEDQKQFNRYLITETNADGESTVKEKVFHKADSKALRDMTAVLKDLTGLLRDFYDEPTPAQKAAREIAEKRLALEKLRSGGYEDDEGRTGVVILPEVPEEEHE